MTCINVSSTQICDFVQLNKLYCYIQEHRSTALKVIFILLCQGIEISFTALLQWVRNVVGLNSTAANMFCSIVSMFSKRRTLVKNSKCQKCDKDKIQGQHTLSSWILLNTLILHFIEIKKRHSRKKITWKQMKPKKTNCFISHQNPLGSFTANVLLSGNKTIISLSLSQLEVGIYLATNEELDLKFIGLEAGKRNKK